MGIRIKDEKLFLVSSMVIMVVIVSAFGYGWIVHEEARTGGMGEKWHMSVTDSYQPNMDMIRTEGSMLFTDTEHHLISLVDSNGVAEWSHDYGAELINYQMMDDDLYLIVVSKSGQYSLDCLSMDGVWKSTTPCPPIYYFIQGEDGGIYASGYENNNYTIYNIEGGSIKWTFTQNGSLVVNKVWDDGEVLLKHMNFSSSMVIDVDEMILLSANGIPQWDVQFPTEYGFLGSSSANVANNGTIVLSYQYDGMRYNQGYTVSGELLWTCNMSVDLSSPDDAYYGCRSNGGDAHHEYIEMVYKVDPANISNNWEIMLNDTWGGSMYYLEGVEVFMSNDGQAFGIDPNGTVLWHVYTAISQSLQSLQYYMIGDSLQCVVDREQGLLLRSENTITKIGKDGSYWTYSGLDSSVKDMRFGPNNTVYVLAYDKMVVLNKPVVSTPTEYMIAMLSVDLLIALSSMLWIADRLVKKPN